jgi:hypothetical protein
MTNNLAEYLRQLELKNSIPKHIERLKRRELEINLYLVLIVGFSISAYFFPNLYFASKTDNRLLLLFMLAWLYFRFEYKYFLAAYDLSIQVRRSNSSQGSFDTPLNTYDGENISSLQLAKSNDYKPVMATSPSKNKSYIDESFMSQHSRTEMNISM